MAFFCGRWLSCLLACLLSHLGGWRYVICCFDCLVRHVAHVLLHSGSFRAFNYTAEKFLFSLAHVGLLTFYHELLRAWWESVLVLNRGESLRRGWDLRWGGNLLSKELKLAFLEQMNYWLFNQLLFFFVVFNCYLTFLFFHLLIFNYFIFNFIFGHCQSDFFNRLYHLLDYCFRFSFLFDWRSHLCATVDNFLFDGRSHLCSTVSHHHWLRLRVVIKLSGWCSCVDWNRFSSFNIGLGAHLVTLCSNYFYNFFLLHHHLFLYLYLHLFYFLLLLAFIFRCYRWGLRWWITILIWIIYRCFICISTSYP